MRKSALPSGTLLSPADYLARERAGTIRHEYVAGELYAMSPVAKRHSTIAFNISRRLYDTARLRSCQLFQDVLVHVAHDRFYYPDVVIACDARDRDEDVVHTPCFVVEVTSPSTRATDLREKAVAYCASASIHGYLIVEQKRRRVIMYHRTSPDEWTKTELAGSGTVDIPCIGASLSLDEIYEDVELPVLAVGENDDEYTREDYERDDAWRTKLGL